MKICLRLVIATERYIILLTSKPCVSLHLFAFRKKFKANHRAHTFNEDENVLWGKEKSLNFRAMD